MANAYETVLVLSVKESEEAAKALAEKFKELISKDGSIENVDEWGKRRLAYPISYETDGYYVVINHSSKPEFITEFARVLNITDGVLRYLTIAKD